MNIYSALAAVLLVTATVCYAGEADVLKVEVTKTGKNVYRFDVTVQHADEGWKHFANRWEVLSPDGKLLATRVLAHPHDKEPFTRGLSGVTVPEGLTKVIVRSHDSVHEYGGKETSVTLPR